MLLKFKASSHAVGEVNYWTNDGRYCIIITYYTYLTIIILLRSFVTSDSFRKNIDYYSFDLQSRLSLISSLDNNSKNKKNIDNNRLLSIDDRKLKKDKEGRKGKKSKGKNSKKGNNNNDIEDSSQIGILLLLS